jgi:hypothetical protein
MTLRFKATTVLQFPLHLRYISISNKLIRYLSPVGAHNYAPCENTRSTGADVAGMQNSLEKRGLITM